HLDPSSSLQPPTIRPPRRRDQARDTVTKAGNDRISAASLAVVGEFAEVEFAVDPAGCVLRRWATDNEPFGDGGVGAPFGPSARALAPLVAIQTTIASRTRPAGGRRTRPAARASNVYESAGAKGREDATPVLLRDLDRRGS